MLFQRRDLLRSAVAAMTNAALPMTGHAFTRSVQETLPDWRTTYEQTLATLRDGELLGIPPSRVCIRQGLHPFTPDRTLILPSHVPTGELVTKLSRKIADRWDRDDRMPSKMAILRIVQAASFLTHTYGVQKRAEDWASRLLSWLFTFYHFVAQDHYWLAQCSWQAQRERVKTRNEVVDWWMILIPDGIEISSIDGTRLHVLITPIFGELGKQRLSIYFWHFMARAIDLQPKAFGGPQTIDTTWREVSRMDRTSACLSVNQRIAHNLSTLVPHNYH